MATTKTIQPTGETITIPAMADQPDMSVVATDLGNITDAVNAQNQAISNINTDLKYVDLGANTLANIESAITSTVANMQDNTQKNIRFTVNPATGIFRYAVYIGTLIRVNNSKWSIMVHADDTVQTIVGERYNNTYYWRELALKSDIEAHTETKTATTDANGYVSLTATESGKTRYYLFVQNKTNAAYLTTVISGSTYGYSPYVRVTNYNGAAIGNTEMTFVLHYILL